MGTNYYRVNIPTEDDIRKLHKLVDERKLLSRRHYWGEENSESVQDLIEECTLSIHLCKMSGGWQVGFDHNWGKYYQPTRDSLEEFLRQPSTCIKNEYGEILTPEEFWKEVYEHNSYSGNRWVSKTYEEWGQKQNPRFRPDICHDDIRKCREIFGVEPEMNDFPSGGLRFNVFSDFC